jgi:hypothetical protein
MDEQLKKPFTVLSLKDVSFSPSSSEIPDLAGDRFGLQYQP